MSLMMLSMVFVMLTMSIASAERICEVLNEKSDITNPEKPDHEVTDGSIRFDHVTFRYNKPLIPCFRTISISPSPQRDHRYQSAEREVQNLP